MTEGVPMDLFVPRVRVATAGPQPRPRTTNKREPAYLTEAPTPRLHNPTRNRRYHATGEVRAHRGPVLPHKGTNNMTDAWVKTGGAGAGGAHTKQPKPGILHGARACPGEGGGLKGWHGPQ
jgi:hypothetical protein